MIQRAFDQIAKADIESLVADGVREIRTLDYKGELPGGSDDHRREFLCDVSSLANAAGGDLLFGVPAKDGIPVEPLGISELNADAAILRMENIIRDGIEPRIPGIRTRELAGFPNGSVLVLRVPKSWAAPHMVTFKNVSRFYSRNSAGKYQLDVSEIRAAFAQSESLAERIQRFRDDRLAKIVADETPVPLADDPKIVLHVVPASAFSLRSALAVSMMQHHRAFLRPFDNAGFDTRVNIDGVVNLSEAAAGKRAFYSQAFRNGAIESVDAYLLGWDEKKTIPGSFFAASFIDTVRSYLTFLRNLDVPPPFIVMCALVGVRGFTFAKHRPTPWPQIAIDRDTVLLPDAVVEEFDCELQSVLRPTLDGLWNAGGFDRCSEYDEDGNWKPQR